MEALDREKRERLILDSLMERRVAVEEESRRLRNELQEMGKREAELRTEILALDQILGALPQPPKENEAPSLFVRAPPPAHPPAAAPARSPARSRSCPRRRRYQRRATGGWAWEWAAAAALSPRTRRRISSSR